eukprot:TRINITY_DN12273_c0_g1_i1.p1 TRINITY_DN12273_c0_g1~~TRINITY_DN12273_c0_g1_i1.p1  ORF type:complete len:364 (+),score=40.33 TRINITY_DN12273_c0_g1_i1:41-1093(+)
MLLAVVANLAACVTLTYVPNDGGVGGVTKGGLTFRQSVPTAGTATQYVLRSLTMSMKPTLSKECPESPSTSVAVCFDETSRCWDVTNYVQQTFNNEWTSALPAYFDYVFAEIIVIVKNYNCDITLAPLILEVDTALPSDDTPKEQYTLKTNEDIVPAGSSTVFSATLDAASALYINGFTMALYADIGCAYQHPILEMAMCVDSPDRCFNVTSYTKYVKFGSQDSVGFPEPYTRIFVFNNVSFVVTNTETRDCVAKVSTLSFRTYRRVASSAPTIPPTPTPTSSSGSSPVLMIVLILVGVLVIAGVAAGVGFMIVQRRKSAQAQKPGTLGQTLVGQDSPDEMANMDKTVEM